MLSPEFIAQQFNTVLTEAERQRMAIALTPELTQLFIKMFGPEYASILQRLDNYKARVAAGGPSAGAEPAMPGMPNGATPFAAMQRSPGPTLPRPVSRLARVNA
jgi:hypothetical protein